MIRSAARRYTARVAVSAILLGGVLVGGCAGPTTPTPTRVAAPPPAPGEVPLSEICPSPVVIQTQWEPQAEHGAVYQLIRSGVSIDAGRKRASAPLVVAGRDTGVRVEVRAGGPAIGFTTVPAAMYLDPSITLGMVETDLAVATSARQPVTAVAAPLVKSPQMLMWDPGSHPRWRSIADIGQSGATVVVSKDRQYPAWLISRGLLESAQLDRGYTGNPARFVADPTIAQQGYATAEPYVYEHKVGSWHKPVRYQLLADVGYSIYPQALSARTEALPVLQRCLSRLVPIIQQAQADYLADPGPVNALLVQLAAAYHDGWDYTLGDAEYALSTMKRLGIVGNDSSGALGGMDPARIQDVINANVPLLAGEGVAVRPGLSPADLATNQFINPSLRLPE